MLDFKWKYFHVAKKDTYFIWNSYMQEYTIDSDWRLRSTVLTPMFIETQASQSALQTWSQEGSLSARGKIARQIRATQQQYDFTPTQNTGNSQPECLPAVHQVLSPVEAASTVRTLSVCKRNEMIIQKVIKNHKKDISV